MSILFECFAGTEGGTFPPLNKYENLGFYTFGREINNMVINISGTSFSITEQHIP